MSLLLKRVRSITAMAMMTECRPVPITATRTMDRRQDITGVEAQNLVGRGISLVPEGRQVFGRMSVEENLILGAYSRPGGAREEDFAHCFALFPRLEERRSQKAGTLSGRLTLDSGHA